MTLEEIGEKFDLTRERVRQIKEKAIRRLRHSRAANCWNRIWADARRHIGPVPWSCEWQSRQK